MSTTPKTARDVVCQLDSELGIVLVGGRGFVGRAVLARSSSPATDVRLADVAGETVIVHLAARADPSWESYASNLRIDEIVARHCAETGASVVYASTNNVYPLELDCSTDGATAPLDRYGVAKLAGEHLLRTSLPESSVVSLRIADVFGPGQRYGNLFKALEHAVATRSPLRRYGEGLKLRSMIQIDELAEVVLHSAHLARTFPRLHATWNVCHQEAWTVREIVDYVAQREGLPVEDVVIEHDASASDQRTMLTSAIPGYDYRHTLREALDAWLNRIAEQGTTDA